MTPWQWAVFLVSRVLTRRLLFVVAALVFLGLVWPWIKARVSSAAGSPVLAGDRVCQYHLGKQFVVDDRGQLCEWDSSWNRVTGCCEVREERAKTDACSACSGSPLLCCHEYEECVACCQARGTIFKWCLGNCRFSSRNIDGIKFKQPSRKYCIRG
jgi:hypothetical protein